MTNNPGAEPTFRVAVFAAPDDPHSLSDVLERTRRLHRTDALIQARNVPGVLPELLPWEQAVELATAISAIGLHSEAIDAGEIPSLEHALPIHHARCLDQGFEILELHGDEQALIPWANLDLLSIGQVPQEQSRRLVASDSTTAVRAGRHVGPTTLETPLFPGPQAWLLCVHPFRAYLIDHKRMNYESLGERKSDSATDNFRKFIDDIVSRARHLYLTPATRAWLEHGSVADYAFATSDDLKRSTVLNLLLHRSRS